MKRRHKLWIALGALALTTAIGGTWAYWTQELWAVNEFQTGAYDSELVEHFSPPAPGEWVPGTAVKKEVLVENRGDVDMAVAIRLHQNWVRTEDVLDEKGNPLPPLKGEQYELTFLVAGSEPERREYAAQINWGETAVVDRGELSQIGAGLGIERVVGGFSDPEAAGRWILVGAEADAYGYSDLCFVYGGIVPGKSGGQMESTSYLLQSVKLNPAVEPTVKEEHSRIWYDESLGMATRSVVYKYSEQGYDSARYTLTVAADTVQATESAIRETWAGLPEPIGSWSEEFIQAFKPQLIPEYVDLTKEQGGESQ